MERLFDWAYLLDEFFLSFETRKAMCSGSGFNPIYNLVIIEGSPR